MSTPDITVNFAYLIGGAALAFVPWERVLKRQPIPALIAMSIITNIILDNMVTIMAQFSYSPTDPNGIATMFFYWFFDGVTTVCAAVAYYLRCKAMTNDKTVQILLAINLIPVGLYLLVDVVGIYSTISGFTGGYDVVYSIGYSLNALLVVTDAFYHIFFSYKISQMMGSSKNKVSRYHIFLPLASSVFLVATSLEIIIQGLNGIIVSSGKLWMAWNLDLLVFLYVNQAIALSLRNPTKKKNAISSDKVITLESTKANPPNSINVGRSRVDSINGGNVKDHSKDRDDIILSVNVGSSKM